MHCRKVIVFKSEPVFASLSQPLTHPGLYFNSIFTNNSTKQSFFICIKYKKTTECPRSYRKSVLHLLKYAANLYLSRCSTYLRYIFGHSVVSVFCKSFISIVPSLKMSVCFLFCELLREAAKNRSFFSCPAIKRGSLATKKKGRFFKL